MPALLALVTLAACEDARSPNDESACATEPECVALYRASVVRLQVCMSERVRGAVKGPGTPPPPECGAMRLESERWAEHVSRFRNRKLLDGADKSEGFEVPPLPSPQPTTPAR